MKYVKKLLVGIVRCRYSLFYSERNTEIKKLLSILTISTLTVSTPAPLLANTSLIRTFIYNLNNDYLPIKEFKNIRGDIYRMTIDSKDNIYFGTSKVTNILQTALSWLKTQSQFNLVYSTKTKTWTQSDLLSIDGELNIDIANPNIDKVFFDNIQQPQTNKHWTINVKPETVPRDHNLQVMFTLNGKQYTSEITVSMQAKIAPPNLSFKQNLSDLIKKTDLGNILDNNDNTIFAAVNKKK